MFHLQEAASKISDAQEADAASRAKLACSLSENASANRSAARVQMASACMQSGMDPGEAMAAAKSFIPSPHRSYNTPVAQKPSMASHLELSENGKHSSAPVSTECTISSPSKGIEPTLVAPSIRSASSTPVVAQTEDQFVKRLVAHMDLSVLMRLSEKVKSTLQTFASYCEAMPRLGVQIDTFVEEFKHVHYDSGVLEALQRIKMRCIE